MLLVYVACIIGIFIVGKIFIIPIKIITKLIINSFLGAVLLYVINIVGTVCGLHIGINVVTALVVGILGIPGAVLLTVLAIFIWNKAIWKRKKCTFSSPTTECMEWKRIRPKRGVPLGRMGKFFIQLLLTLLSFLAYLHLIPYF